MHTPHYYQPPGTMHDAYCIVCYFYCLCIACDDKHMIIVLVNNQTRLT